MHLPTWDELFPEQREIFDYPSDQSLFAVGPPGSGKTTMAIHRASVIAGSGRTVALVTFNRMLRRLVRLLGVDDAHTMHSYVGTHYHERTGLFAVKRPGDSYAHDWDAMIQRLDTYATRRGKLDHLVVDEGQDLPQGFFRYAVRHIASNISVFADEDQAVGRHRSTLLQIRDGAGLGDPMLLQVNHRNTLEIASVAEHFHRGRLPVSTVTRASIQDIPRLHSSKSNAAIALRIANWFENRRGTIGVVVRSNDAGLQVHAELRRLLPDRRVDIYTSNKCNEDEIELDNPGVTVLNVESVKGQEFNTLFLLELETFVPCRTERDLRVMYMLCARARDHLWLVHGPGNLSPGAHAALPHHLLQRVP